MSDTTVTVTAINHPMKIVFDGIALQASSVAAYADGTRIVELCDVADASRPIGSLHVLPGVEFSIEPDVYEVPTEKTVEEN